jgi:hypothetical protein
MAKKHRIHPQGSQYIRESIPQPRDVAEFVAPRTVNEGLSVKTVFGDIGDMVDPFITAAIEKQEGLRDVSDDELKMLAALGSIPVAGAVASKLTKKLNKLVPNPKGGFVQAVFLPKQGNKAILVKPKNATELEQFNKAIDLAVEKGQIPKADGAKMKFNAASDIKQQQSIQRAINSRVIDPDKIPTPINELKPESVRLSDMGNYNKAKNVGLKYKVNEYPSGITREGNRYYTTGEGGNQLLYSENSVDASNARHALTDYDKKWQLAKEELIKQLPNPRRPGNYMPILDVDGNYVNPYKTVTEPAMLKGRLPYRSEEAANMSISEGKRALENNPRYMSPDDFLKYMLGLEP